MFLFMESTLLFAVIVGCHAVRMRARRLEDAPVGPVGSAVAAVLGLLAFMLGGFEDDGFACRVEEQPGLNPALTPDTRVVFVGAGFSTALTCVPENSQTAA
jgi:hypothetical protein